MNGEKNDQPKWLESSLILGVVYIILGSNPLERYYVLRGGRKSCLNIREAGPGTILGSFSERKKGLLALAQLNY